MRTSPEGLATTSPTNARTVVSGLALALFAVVVMRTAWLSDTAYLTLRTVEHAAAGFGWRWNAVERVPVFDHPLWFVVLLLGRLVSGELYFTTLAISIAVSFATVAVMLRQATSDEGIVFVGVAVCLSPIFITFSTSGLESPLLHLLVAAAVLVTFRSFTSPTSQVLLATLSGLALATRWNTLLLLAPVLGAVVTNAPRSRRVWLLTLATVPLLAWMAWSFCYYGVIGPNSWIAEHSAHVSWMERWREGLSFVVATIHEDPLLVTVIVAGATIGFATGGIGSAWGTGSVLFTVWVIGTGGSEMAGRDLTVPFVVGAMLAARVVSLAKPIVAASVVACAVALGWLAPVATYASDNSFGTGFHATTRAHDARAEDYQATGLLLMNRVRVPPIHPEAERARTLTGAGEKVALSKKPGFFGAAAGPDVYVFSDTGTLDPLLARLPMAVGMSWMWQGRRRVPDSYVARLADGTTPLSDVGLRPLDEDLRLVTRGPLAGPGRIGALFRLWTDTNARVRASSYGTQHLALADLNRRDPGAATSVPVAEGGLAVEFGRRLVTRLDVTLSLRYDYEIAVVDGDNRRVVVQSRRAGWQDGGVSERRIVLDRPVEATGVVFRCGDGIGPCLLSHLNVVD